jgi:hypothetical protein
MDTNSETEEHVGSIVLGNVPPIVDPKASATPPTFDMFEEELTDRLIALRTEFFVTVVDTMEDRACAWAHQLFAERSLCEPSLEDTVMVMNYATELCKKLSGIEESCYPDTETSWKSDYFLKFRGADYVYEDEFPDEA